MSTRRRKFVQVSPFLTANGAGFILAICEEGRLWATLGEHLYNRVWQECASLPEIEDQEMPLNSQ